MHADLNGPRSKERFRVEIKTDTEDRLIGTCFRGKEHALAGNFCRWDGAREFLDDPEVRETLARWIERAVNEPRVELKAKFDARVCLPFSGAVGWGSTIPQSLVDGKLPERPFPNKPDTIASWVPWNATLLAPATNLVTLSARFRTRTRLGCWEAELGTVYPGADIGPLRPPDLRPDHAYFISRHRRIAFFEWTHRGEPVSPS